MKWTRKFRALWIAAIVIAVFGVTPAWSSDIIKIATPFPTTTLDPNSSAASGNLEMFWQLYATLIRYDDKGELAPGLAKSWEFSDDGTQLTLHLRDADFSDGSPLTAKDVVFTIERVRDSDDSAYPAPVSSIDEVTAPNAHTVVLTLKHTFAPILANLTIYNTGIVSKDAVQGNDNAFASNPVTSGPYRVKQWKPNDRIILEANPHYWRTGYPKNDGAEFIDVADKNTRVDMLLSGEVDAVRNVPWSQMDRLAQNDSINVPNEPSTQIYLIMVNHDKPPFDNKDVRRAAAYALNKKAIAKAVTFGHAKPANTTLNDTLKYYNADYKGLQYNPKKAKELIKEADIGDQTATIITTSVDKKLATLIQAQWAAVGLKSKINLVDTGTWWKRLIGGDYSAAPNWYLNETSDPDLAVRWALCGTCGNRAYYTNYDSKKVDELTEKAARAQDASARKKLYYKIQDITTQSVAEIPLYYPVFNNAYSTRVTGLGMTSHVDWTLENAEVAD